MKINKILASTFLMAVTAMNLHAAGAAAGIDIDNSATLDFEVGAVVQPSVVSNIVTFKVDNKIDMTVIHQDASIVIGAPATDLVTKFTVTNLGNNTQDYILSALQTQGNPFGATDNFDPDATNIFVDTDGDGIYTVATDTDTFIDELLPDASIDVFVVSSINAAQLTGDQSEHTLVAQAAVGGAVAVLGAAEVNTIGADTDIVMDVVFADGAGLGDPVNGANTGFHSDYSAVEVLIPAALSIVKSSIVTNDPVNLGINPKRIPGATVRYCFTVDNTGGASADLVKITDNMTLTNNDQLTVVKSGFVLQAIATACDCAAIVDASGVFAAPNVTIDLGTVTGTPTPLTQRGCAYIEATIN